MVSPTAPGQATLPRYQGSVRFSGDGDAWWVFSLSDIAERALAREWISFGAGRATPGLGLEPCAVEELPAGLQRASARFETGGWREPTLMGGLRGKKRGVVLQCLYG